MKYRVVWQRVRHSTVENRVVWEGKWRLIGHAALYMAWAWMGPLDAVWLEAVITPLLPTQEAYDAQARKIAKLEAHVAALTESLVLAEKEGVELGLFDLEECSFYRGEEEE